MAILPKADKELGQHFLRDQNVITKITEDYKDVADVIIEVGPGPAILSQHLVKYDLPFYFIEKDIRFSEQLDPIVPEENRIYADAVKFNWPEFIKQHDLQDKKIWLVSNLPYNVSSPLFFSFVQVPQIKYMTLMFQKEVGEKTYNREHQKNQMSSILSIALNFFETKQLIKVSPGAFTPPPKVDSVVVSYSRHENPVVPLSEYKKYETFLRSTFQQRRKQIGSVLRSAVPKEKKDDFFKNADVLPTLRAEALKLEQIYALYKSFKDIQ
jgi:16S rRNA (adenine1518-N6/adenine1519-N6)-dimethyltransferase